MDRVVGYDEITTLGAGSQGRVVLARARESQTVVAIKYLDERLLTDAHSRAVFRAEAQSLHRVVSPYVAKLISYHEVDRMAAIVMEAVPGTPLRRVLDERIEPFTPEAALAVLKGSLLGLAAAHDVGVVHRDYKPGNVIVRPDGCSKLIDFGIAVLAGQAGTGGTPAYMAPEQWMGGPASTATDVYAATCVFVECVSGAKPYQAATLDELRDLHLQAWVPTARVPERLAPVVAWGMAKNPAERLDDAAEFAGRIEALAVEAFGPDWERRGLVALGSVIAALGLAVPVVAASGALLGSAGAGAGASGVGGHAAVAAGHSAGAGGKGVLAKIGGTKGAAALGAGAGAAVAVGVFVAVPRPDVGGQSTGTVEMGFARPSVLFAQPYMPASETPLLRHSLTVQPARAKKGTLVKVTDSYTQKLPFGSKYLSDGTRQCFGAKSSRTDGIGTYSLRVGISPEDLPPDRIKLGLFRAPEHGNSIPPESGIDIDAHSKTINEKEPYVPAQCAQIFSGVDEYTFRIPRDGVLSEGRYLLAYCNPVRFTKTSRYGVAVDPKAAGAYAKGSLPELQIIG
ncbi:serine/threonine-protein kinase [Actinomadura atramentaria]|uniref:serine/threonine-protein kinase n=1 Tax=Actinomadura atramentaria TaxID=1990 RepID=UPI00146C722B|nr:serine/threonine-protein kinase [Actinomadura atramentaria]